jgi:divalent metal cation (Fe/Co/Zn/Cd) transporter
MNEQNYANHGRYVTGFHFIAGSILIIGAVLSAVNLWLRWSANDEIMTPILIVLLFTGSLFLFWFSRQFAIKAQDRAIRAEENLRYFILTRKPLDSGITMGQVIALRFAPDDEFLALADRAVNEKLSAREIKQAIKQWRTDHHRA